MIRMLDMLKQFPSYPRERREEPARTATYTIPIDGFVNSDSGSSGSIAAAGPAGIAMGWIRSVLGACMWAALIAAGMLVYTHFTNKWVQKGYPAVPINALAPGNPQAAHMPGQPIPMGPPSNYNHQPRTSYQNATPAPQQPPTQRSVLDEYEG